MDGEFAGVHAGPRRERVPGKHAFQVGRRAEDDVGAEAAGALDGVLDPLAQANQVACRGSEENIAGVDVGLDVFESEGLIQRPQFVHLHLVVAADIHPPEHRDQHRHMRYRIPHARSLTGCPVGPAQRENQNPILAADERR